MPRFTLRSYGEILRRMLARVVGRTRLSDVEDGAGIKQVLAAGAREVEDIYAQLRNQLTLFDMDRCEGEDLDEVATVVEPDGVAPRRGPTRATTSLTLTSNNPLGSDVPVPIGTTFASVTDGQKFRATEEVTIVIPGIGPPGTAAISVQAEGVGTDYNVAAGTITRIVSSVPGLDAATNPTAVVDGTDREGDDGFRARIKGWMRSLSTSPNFALEALAQTVGVTEHVTGAYGDAVKVCEETTPVVRTCRFASVVEDPANPCWADLYVDDGTGFDGVAAGYLEATVTEAVVTGATAGDRRIRLPHWPVAYGAAFTLEVQAGGAGAWVPLTLAVDFWVTQPDGRIVLSAGAALGAADNVRATYTHSLDLVRAVQLAVVGDATDKVRWPGWKSTGTQVWVKRPAVYSIDVIGSLSVDADHDATEALSTARTRITTYLNSLTIGANVVFYQLIEECMRVEGVIDCAITTPPTDVAIPYNQIARAQTIF